MNIKLTYCFYRWSHTLMACQKYYKYVMVEFSYSFNNLITVNGAHKEIQQEYVKMLCLYAFNSLYRIIFSLHIKTDRLEI